MQNAVSFFEYAQRSVAAVALKIVSVPNGQLLEESDELAVERVKNIFATMINEYACYRTDGSLALELFWSCTPAKNQPFRSYVDLAVIFRAVGANRAESYAHLEKVCADFAIGLDSLKVVYNYVDVAEYQSKINAATNGCVQALRRRDDLMGFNTPMFPFCYKYDAIEPVETDLDPIVGTLINETDGAVIIQLIPSCFQDNEKMYISGCLNSLGMLQQGIPIPKMGFFRDARAEIPMRTYRKYYEYLNAPLLTMNIFTCGTEQGASRLSSKLITLLNDSGGEHQTSFEVCNVTHLASLLKRAYISPWAMTDQLMAYGRGQGGMQSAVNASTYRLSSLYTPAEVSQVFRLPIGTNKVTAGVTIHEIEKRHKKFSDGVIDVADLSIGRLQNVIGGENAYIGVNKKDLTRHMLVVGTPGSGKSTFLVGAMDRLWKKLNIPFVVIEPAKYEYRALIDSIPELQVFSPGKHDVAPFVLNPFVPPKGVTVEKYKSIVKSAFSAAFEMWTPLDQLFDETLNICYSEQGWLDSHTVENAAECFSLADFIKTYKEVVGSKGYNGEYKKQIEAAGVLRFNGLLEQNINIFDSRYSLPIEDILSKPTVIELSNIKDVKQKSFIIAMLLNNIYAYVESNHSNDGQLKNVILLEEAHALLGGDVAAQGEGTNQSNAAAVKLLTDMLAEIRSRGVGIVVADQSPKKVTSQVIANTNVKVMFRLVEADDKDIVKRSTTMDDTQHSRLSKLGCGQALLYFDKLDEVEEVAMDDYRLNSGISTDLSDAAIKSRMTYWQHHGQWLKPYRDCDFIPACSTTCDVVTRERARVVTDRIFRKYYPQRFSDMAGFAEFYKKIGSVIREETEAIFGDPLLASRIGHCVRVQLLRRVYYYADINIDLNKRKKIYASMPPVNG